MSMAMHITENMAVRYNKLVSLNEVDVCTWFKIIIIPLYWELFTLKKC